VITSNTCYRSCLGSSNCIVREGIPSSILLKPVYREVIDINEVRVAAVNEVRDDFANC
jgi:hypothetical protein